MSASNPAPAAQADDASHTSPQRPGSGLNPWGWLALFLFITSGIAIVTMLILKWTTGGGEVWPWFTRYSYFAFPAAFLCLILSLLHTLLQRRRA
ncbi:hypothetical protein FCK90_05975 [Kocuria coralli]|uniref:Uncharacterized protein n=1 Tax=Kocuria coralli TaxID=1461025 RepID=A0A5J5KYG6_9MICC|nr:hypothetical protein [Kocuria coralli]KAA9394713.1 hypothetical protein FCK90_05975 [Kocuria coralli]